MKNESELSHSFRSTLDLAVRLEVRFRSMNTVEDVVVDCLLVYDEDRGSLSILFSLPSKNDKKRNDFCSPCIVDRFHSPAVVFSDRRWVALLFFSNSNELTVRLVDSTASER